jgi:predicted metal-dependent HD superfamily phosphohydrolase
MEGAHQPVSELLPDFVRACRDAQARAPVVDIEGAGMDLVRRWTGADRGYHDLEHLREVLDRLAELGMAQPEVLLAAWFHDAVYEGHPGQDEELSAVLADAELSALGVPVTACRRVAALVRVTADHRAEADDAGAACLCDADLAVLAADVDRYARYIDGVRSEYAHLDDAAFRVGRLAVLRSLSARPVLFQTAQGRQRWEEAARRNLAAEIERLEACG